MKTVEQISKILNFSILALAILGVGVMGLGHVMQVHSDAGDIFIIVMFLINLSWVANAIRCYVHSGLSGVRLPKLIHIVNSLAFGSYLLFIIFLLMDVFLIGSERWLDEWGPYMVVVICVLVVIDWIVCTLYLSKQTKEEFLVLNKRSATWLGGGLLVLLSGLGVYWIVQYNKPNYQWHVSDTIVENRYRHGSNKLVDNATGQPVLEDYTRLILSEGADSLALFFKNGRRGYINLNSGEVVVSATTYTHAWVFSEGLAAVEKEGKIGFINPQGEVVIDFLYDYDKNILNAYGFHHGRCLMMGKNKKLGVIDQEGNWMIKPEYDDVVVTPDYVVVGKKGELKKMIDFEGHILQENIFDSSHGLRYERYYEDENGLINCEYVLVKGICVYRVDGLEGLMTDNARIITPPVYESISAHDEQHFRAKLQDGYSEVWLNRKGEIINCQ